MTQLLNNRYQIINTIGRGGFGETFLSEDTYMPSRRRCVIKQLKPLVSNPQVYQLVQDRFEREAAILEALGEDNSQIPTLYAYFSEGGQFYLVQEWVEGNTLGQCIQQQGLLSEETIREILRQILPVLDYIHGKGIVHRDIKPDNIILRDRDRAPVLIDFGAVRETMATQLNSQGNTTSSIIIGTPGFMPSEQAAGRPLFSSDLYSLGLTAIYLLTGKLPQQLTDAYTGEIDWHPYASQVSPELMAVLDTAIQSHPRDRFPTAREMLNGLESVSGTVPLAATLLPPEQEETIAVTPPPAISQQPVPPTVPASPAISQQPVPPTVPASPATPPPREGKNAIFSSLIIGGLVSAAIVGGFFLIKPGDSEDPVINSVETPTAANSCPWVTNDPQPPTNVRSTPEVQENNIVGTIPNDTEISVVMAEDGWLKISAPVEGWISANLARNTCSSPPKIVQNSPTPKLPRRQPKPQTNYDWLSDREVTAEDLQGKTAFELSIMRNSIFARHGRKFDARELQAYFDNQTWYRSQYEPNAFPDNLLTGIERQNAAYILQYQNENNLRWIAEKPERPSVTQALVDYYSLINNAQYETAWTQLSKTFQNNSTVHPDGYTSYTNWWTQVNRVDLGEMNVVESGAEVARIEVPLTFKMQNGGESRSRIRFKFVWDERAGKWLIDDTKGL